MGLCYHDQAIIRLLTKGKSTKEIADTINLSSRTVENRIEDLKTLYHCDNLVSLIVKLDQLGFVKLD